MAAHINLLSRYLITCQLMMVKKWLRLLTCCLVISLTCQLMMVKKWLRILTCYLALSPTYLLVDSLTCPLV